MQDCPHFRVPKNTLLAVAGSIWLLAGINVARLGILSYLSLSNFPWWQYLLGCLVFCGFGTMFWKVSKKHIKRIRSYRQNRKPIWHFFNLRSYFLLAFMMSGGIYLRNSGQVPPNFIAYFYTALGIALALAGGHFWWSYLQKH